MANSVFSSQSASILFLMALTFTSSRLLALDRILPPSISLTEFQSPEAYSLRPMLLMVRMHIYLFLP